MQESKLKFRAWNTAAKMWQTEWSGMSCDGRKLVLLPNGDYAVSNGVELVFQEFTGAVDKNGKDIYEGDIVRVYVGKNRKELTMLVKRVVGGFTPLTLWKQHWEIIGNMFDNPELLSLIKPPKPYGR